MLPLSLVPLALVSLTGSQVHVPAVSPVERNEGWRSDLDHFVAEAQRVHASPDRPAFSEEFDEAAQLLRADIPDLSNDEILVRFMRLAAILNDGHTAVYGAGGDTPLEFERRMLPFKFYLFPDGLYVVDGVGEWAEHAGRRVERFGDVAAAEVLDRLSDYRGVDNEMTWTWMGPQFYVGRLSLLRAAGVSVDGGAVEVTLRSPGEEPTSHVVEGGHYPLVRKLRPSPASTGETPLFLSNVESNYWLEPLAEHDAVYVQFNQVRDAADESLEEFAERLRRALAEQDATRLIVDVRHNNGGNNNLVRPLVRAMIEFDMRSPDHRIFVLMGRNTFSAAQNFINRVERWTDATFVGEPSSSSPNFVGEENEFVLPFSRVHGSISNQYWQDSDPWDRRSWIEPDVPVALTAEQYFAGVDPLLERIL